MLKDILFAGLLAGVLAGLCNAGLQLVTTVPLILKAETYENAAATAPARPIPVASVDDLDRPAEPTQLAKGAVILAVTATTTATAPQAHEHSAGSWAPQDGAERSLYTVLSTIGTAVGFAFILLAVMQASGVPITPRNGAIWGLGGFIATGLAPALGLPPELPGAAAADLVERQGWWLLTAGATALGLWLMFNLHHLAGVALGLALLLAPHVIGAPHPDGYASSVPSELTGHFVASALVVHAALWGMLGALAGVFWPHHRPG